LAAAFHPDKENTMNSALHELSPFASKYGPWAVVTGASDGIGRAIAFELAARGLSVALVARREATLTKLATDLTTRHSRISARVIAADLGDSEGLSIVVERTNDLDVGLLVAAAGFGTSQPFIDAELQTELNMIDVNCKALAAVAHHFGNRLARRGRGGIILMSSLVAFQGVPRAANYSATKAYVQSLAEGLAIELKARGVDVLASAPGPVRSGFEKRAGMAMNMGQTPEEVACATLAALGRKTTVRPGALSVALELALAPLPRWGRVRIMQRVMASMTGA
jgi:short-subunit dehydrogenase